jgi:hypothetical protein
VTAQLGVTLPAALLVLLGTALELGAGLALARLARRRAFGSIVDAALAAMVVTVIKGALLVGLLGGVGLFRAPVLIAIDVALVAALVLAPRLRGLPLRPILDGPGVVARLAVMPASVPLAILVAVVWAGPVVLQLASPVVPFIDVLPNYVGPAEHLRTFGTLVPLSATQSPIIGPSRSVLGYDGLLGSLATITGLPAVIATAGYILPSTLLVAAGIQRLARALAGRGVAVGPWALLAFALTESFARLADARGTVIVLPLVCGALALAVERFADNARPEEAQSDGWRGGTGVAMGVGLAAAVFVHPVIGAFAIATLAILTLVRPARLAVHAAVAALTAGVMAIPQLGVMLGLAVPPLALVVAIVAGLVAGLVAGRLVAARPALASALVAVARWGRVAAVAAVVIGVVTLVVGGTVDAGRLGGAIGQGLDLALTACGVLLAGLALGLVIGAPSSRSWLLVATVVVGLAAVVVTQLLPGNLGFLGDALRFEVPKTVHYWLPVFVAVAVGPALAAAWTPSRLPWAARMAAVLGIVAVAALPLRTEPIDAYHLGEHRWSEAVAIDLRYAGSGFWIGFPDSRTLVDPPRQAIADAIRGEIDAGRIRHDTPVLHVASSFQEWVATPLGVFDGVLETDVSLDPEVSHQTVGGRLYGLPQLATFLAGGDYPYVVLEPRGLPETLRGQVLDAGYRSIFANDQGEVFVLGT